MTGGASISKIPVQRDKPSPTLKVSTTSELFSITSELIPDRDREAKNTKAPVSLQRRDQLNSLQDAEEAPGNGASFGLQNVPKSGGFSGGFPPGRGSGCPRVGNY